MFVIDWINIMASLLDVRHCTRFWRCCREQHSIPCFTEIPAGRAIETENQALTMQCQKRWGRCKEGFFAQTWGEEAFLDLVLSKLKLRAPRS